MKSPRIRLRSVGPQIKQSAWESRHRLRIGRMADLEVRVKDPSISRVHAEVTLGRDGWVVRDLGSTNGTFVNGVRLGDEECRLNKRDLLQCGNIVMLVNLVEELPSEPRLSSARVTTQKSWEEAIEFSSLETTKRKPQRLTSYLG